MSYYYDDGIYDDDMTDEERRINYMVAGFNPSAPDSLSEALGNSDLTCLARLVDYGQGDATIALKAVRMIYEISDDYWRNYAGKVIARKEDRT